MTARVATIVTLLRHAWARHRVPLIPIALAVGLFQFLLTRIAPMPNEVSWMSSILDALPPEVRTLAGAQGATTPGGFLAIGYTHPFFLILMSTWIIRVSSAAVSGEIGAGTMDLLASRPVPRWTFAAAGLKAIALGLALIVGCGWIGTAIGLHARPVGVEASALLPVAGAAWLLFAAWGAVGLAIGTTRRDGGQAIGWTTAVMAGSFVLEYLARLWSPLAGWRPLSLFRYYEPQVILASGIPRQTLIVLVAALAAGFVVALGFVRRRDL